MNIIFLLIGCSVFVALIFLIAFFWANKTGQHDDLYTPSIRILFDDTDSVVDRNEESDQRPGAKAKA